MLVFVHGGGFSRGDKRVPGGPYNDNVALMAARGGLVGVTMNYPPRAGPHLPAGAEDVAAAVRWLRAEIARFGGDRTRIVLMGASAGAALVASYFAHPQTRGGEAAGAAGAVLVSDYTTWTTAGSRISPRLLRLG